MCVCAHLLKNPFLEYTLASNNTRTGTSKWHTAPSTMGRGGGDGQGEEDDDEPGVGVGHGD